MGRFDNGLDRRVAFVTMRYKISDKYRTPLRKFKRDHTGSKKCASPFKLRGYVLSNIKWIFNVICGLHNHDMCEKLVEHPIACRLTAEEKEIDPDMILNMAESKNILATLKRKSPKISQISSMCIIFVSFTTRR